jgi:hypothetical protein
MAQRRAIAAVLLGALAQAACQTSAPAPGAASGDDKPMNFVPYVPGDTGAGSNTQTGSSPSAPHNCESDATC